MANEEIFGIMQWWVDEFQQKNFDLTFRWAKGVDLADTKVITIEVRDSNGNPLVGTKNLPIEKLEDWLQMMLQEVVKKAV